MIVDNKKRIISSESQSTIKDNDGNIINIENFQYNITSNIFKSIGYVKIEDKMQNSYEFSQLYIDTKKKEILGTDIKAFLNQDDFKINKQNKPRIFGNTLKLNKNKSSFSKSVFTICDYRENNKCPPWTIQASEMLHDNKKKTIFYEHAVIKVYDIPIFYVPRLSHPDPSVDRRSGFLPPSITNSKNLGTGISLPYFFAVSKDKNLTVNTRIYDSEHPLFLGEYHQVFKDSYIIADFGFTEGYKNTSSTKKAGDKSHFFSKFVKNFKGKNNSLNTLSFDLQDTNNDKYLKLYKIKSNLVDYNEEILKSTLNFTHEKEDVFFGLSASMYETMKEDYNDKYEYIFPEITLDKNLISDEKLGYLDLQTNVKVHNYDTNKLTNFIINDFNWNSKEISMGNGIINKFLGNIKNINYEAKNIDLYKDDPTSEVFGAIGLLSELNLRKNNLDTYHSLKPKFLLRYAPGDMRKEKSGPRLNPNRAFFLNRLNNLNNFETGLTGTMGLDYKVKNKKQDFDFSIAQIINAKENKKMADKTSLNEKLSDLVGSARVKFNENISFNYSFSVDQNYKDLNYNDFETTMKFGSADINFNYLTEKKHIGNQDYFKTKINLKNKENSVVSFETKRDLITNSSEYYNLSYEYVNDCLRAGLVYRREFYNDSELEPENSLMFKITLVPFGDISTPTFSN